MEKETMCWLFSTAPQAMAALIGIVFTGMFFMAESIDNRVRADSSLYEIGGKAKEALYKNMRVTAVLFAVTLIVDLILIYAVDCLYVNSLNKFYDWPILVFCVSNLSTLIIIFRFVFNAVSPNYFDRIAANMSKQYGKGDVDNGTFISHFIEFEKAVRSLPEVAAVQRQRHFMPLPEISNILIENRIINRNEARQLSEIRKVRNLILHRGGIDKVSSTMDQQLQDITRKIKNYKG